MDVTAVIWDWNGTLLDDVAFSAALLNRQLARHGCAPLEGGLAAYRRVFRFPIEEYYRDAGFDLARTPYGQLAEEYMAIYEPESRDCPLQPHARAALEGLRDAGLTQVVLSASEEKLLLRQLAHYGLAEGMFAQVLGLSNILGRSKAEMGRAWMEQSHVDPAPRGDGGRQRARLGGGPRHGHRLCAVQRRPPGPGGAGGHGRAGDRRPAGAAGPDQIKQGLAAWRMPRRFLHHSARAVGAAVEGERM